jgi:hypothetical protein
MKGPFARVQVVNLAAIGVRARKLSVLAARLESRGPEA